MSAILPQRKAYMNLTEKIESVKVDNRYDIRICETTEIAGAAKDSRDAVYMAFRYGYLKGQRAIKAEYKNRSESATDILRRLNSNKSIRIISDLERSKISIIQKVSRCDNEIRITRLEAFVGSYLDEGGLDDERE